MSNEVEIICEVASGAFTPSYAHPGDAGLDIYASVWALLRPGVTLVVPTGVKLAIPEGYFGSCRERSSLAAKGIRLGGGVIDSGYRGEIRGIFTNLSDSDFEINRGDRIFQIVIQPFVAAHLTFDTLSLSSRGANGFGSTGR